MEKMMLPSALTQASSVTTSGTEAEKNWTAFMSPGAEHVILAYENGHWDEEFFFYEAPGAAPKKAHAVCFSEMILGGRYQRSRHKGSIMGMPFEGECISGYDNGRKVFFSTWIDNMGTDMMYSEGQYNAEKRRIEYNSSYTDAKTGVVMHCKQFMTFTDTDHMVLERYITHQGEEFMSMAVQFVRKK